MVIQSVRRQVCYNCRRPMSESQKSCLEPLRSYPGGPIECTYAHTWVWECCGQPACACPVTIILERQEWQQVVRLLEKSYYMDFSAAKRDAPLGHRIQLQMQDDADLTVVNQGLLAALEDFIRWDKNGRYEADLGIAFWHAEVAIKRATETSHDQT